MGIHLEHMTHSPGLKAKLTDLYKQYGNQLGGAADMSSTAGYDNDGSTGPELLDNGVELAFAARDYDRAAIVFYAIVRDTCYYQFGTDEADAIRRLTEATRDCEPCEADEEDDDEDGDGEWS